MRLIIVHWWTAAGPVVSREERGGKLGAIRVFEEDPARVFAVEVAAIREWANEVAMEKYGCERATIEVCAPEGFDGDGMWFDPETGRAYARELRGKVV